MNEKRIATLRGRDVQPPSLPPAPRDPEEIMASLEQDILAVTDLPRGLERSRGLGNSTDMTKVRELLSNAVTAAHDDTCTALDKVVEDARSLLDRITKTVEKHKKALQEEGQKIAVQLEASVQELSRTVEWVEKQGPKLRNPQMPETKPTEN